jgi:RecB family exonuclease
MRGRFFSSTPFKDNPMTSTVHAPPQGGVRDRPHLSASQLRTYSNCSLQWFFSRRYAPEFVGAALVFGTAFHAAIEAYYQGQLEGQETTAEELMDVFNRTWKMETLPISYGKDEITLFTKAEKMIDAFLATVNPGEVIAVEEPFVCDLAEGVPPLVGTIDLIEVRRDETGARRLHLVDFKTAARKPSNPTDLNDDQLILYGVGAHRSGLLAQFDMPFCLEYRVVTKTKTPEVISIPIEPDKHDALRLIEKARVCWRGMEAGVCFPSPNWMCANCGYKSRCGKWPNVD